MSAGSKSSDGLDDATCTIMETSMLEEEGYFDPAEGSGAGLSGAGGKKRLESLCRVCANVSDYFIPVFEREGAEHQLDMKIRKHLPIRVLETDGLPAQVCYQCASTLIAWHDLVTACVEADKKLHRLLLEEEDDDYADRDEKVVEFFNEPPVDSDGEDFSEPSTSAAVVETKECLPPQKKRTSGKGKQQRKAQRASNASPESGAKGNTALSDSKETGAGQKGAVDSALSTERLKEANIYDVTISLGNCSRLTPENSSERLVPRWGTSSVFEDNEFMSEDCDSINVACSGTVQSESDLNVKQDHVILPEGNARCINDKTSSISKLSETENKVTSENANTEDQRISMFEDEISCINNGPGVISGVLSDGETLTQHTTCKRSSEFGAVLFDDLIILTKETLITSDEIVIASDRVIDSDVRNMVSDSNGRFLLENNIVSTRDEPDNSNRVFLKAGSEIHSNSDMSMCSSILFGEDQITAGSEMDEMVVSHEVLVETESSVNCECDSSRIDKDLWDLNVCVPDISVESKLGGICDLNVKNNLFSCRNNMGVIDDISRKSNFLQDSIVSCESVLVLRPTGDVSRQDHVNERGGCHDWLDDTMSVTMDENFGHEVLPGSPAVARNGQCVSAVIDTDENCTNVSAGMYSLFADLYSDKDKETSASVSSDEEASRSLSYEAYFMHELLAECDKIAVCEDSSSSTDSQMCLQDSDWGNSLVTAMDDSPPTISERREQEKLFSCEMCSKTFKFNDVLQAHVRRVHSHKKSAKPFICSLCKSEFRSSMLLKEHRNLCDMDQEVLFRCDYCNRMLKSKLYLRKHIQRHLDAKR
ncbi:uncharacterized protein LOC134532306 isoform X3 [Bacillus rossius redtenbacheri]|uniref:uncharacterized protein LOC134532306 isoform X3 n=1 Tax=Bacillus rossius redtenbacheri TaxID=93214 RepID=UPI002FDC816E